MNYNQVGFQIHKWLSRNSFKICNRYIESEIERTKDDIREGNIPLSRGINYWVRSFNGRREYLYEIFCLSIALTEMKISSFSEIFQVSKIAFKIIKIYENQNWSLMKRVQRLTYLSAILFLKQLIEPKKSCLKILRWYRQRKILYRCRSRNLLRNLLPLNEDLLQKIVSYL